MVTNIIIRRIKRRNATAILAAVVQQLLKQPLYLPARQATRTLKEGTYAVIARDILQASDVLSVLEPLVVVKSLGLIEEFGKFEATGVGTGAGASAFAVDAFGGGSDEQATHGGGDD